MVDATPAVVRDGEDLENGDGPGRVLIRREYAAILRHNALMSCAQVFAADAGDRLGKPGLAAWRERRRLVLRGPDGGAHTFYLKRYTRPPLVEQVRRILSGRPRTSTAGREWDTIVRLTDAGIPAPAPAALGEEMHGWFERRSFLLLAEVPGESLERWLPVHWRQRASGLLWRRRRELIDGLARQVAAFHAAGFVHRDLYTSHIFVLDRGREGPAGFCFIDLQRVFRPRWRRARWVVKDLAALHLSTEAFVSRPDRLRFWRRYVECAGDPAWSAALAGRVLAKGRRMRRHHERRIAAGARRA